MDGATYTAVIASLRTTYDRNADERDRGEVAAWKQRERQRFLDLLRAEGRESLLEIGAGTGKDGLFFQQHGLDVTCTDLSPTMVEHCRRKGLRAEVRDFLHLGFPPASFTAVYALNCLLHVPKADLSAVLTAIQTVLHPGGLFYFGLYGGIDFEGVWPEDHHQPQRFFSFHTDDGIQQAVQSNFTLLSFRHIQMEGGASLHFQALVLRR